MPELRSLDMIDPNPAPTIPDLGADNAIDLDKLGSSDLQTYIGYDGITDGDTIILNWRGCGKDGTVVDNFNDQVDVIPPFAPEGMPVRIENYLLSDLRDGWAFYSYRILKVGEANPGDESLRRFFYIGKRPRAMPDLPVLQIKESHDLHLDLSSAPPILGVYAVPYEAMGPGDIVTLHCRRFYDDGTEYTPALAHPTQVEAADVGKPLALYLKRSDLLRVEDGRIELNYGIQYANTVGEKTLSATQTLYLFQPTSALLPALEVVGHTGGVINPAQFPEGLPLRIEAYPGMGVGDDVLCYASSKADGVEPLTLPARVDVSTIDKGFLEFQIDPKWLVASNGAQIDLQYQYAWTDAAMSATPYPATIRTPLRLPMVIVEGALPGEEPVPGEGELNVLPLTIRGVTLRIDEEANYAPDDTVEVFWDGHGSTGRYSVTTPTTEGGRTFTIPPQYIPANFGKTVPVYYRVTPKGETSYEDSKVYGVRVLAIPKSSYPTIQSTQAQQTNGQISLSNVPAGGELFSLRGWPYIRDGQTLNAILSGKDATDQPLTFAIFNNHAVTAAEFDARLVSTLINVTELRRFKLGAVTVQVTVTYEEGAETRYNEARFTLIA
jgi:hypothetical protein